MENVKKNTGLYWFLFILSLVACYFSYQAVGGVTIMILPFVCTFLVKALDIM